jgi:tRNA-dihydrouridine synthase
MFTETKIKTYANLLGFSPNELGQYAKRMASYFQTQKVISKNVIINSLFILQQMHDEKNRNEAEKIKYKTKNLAIIKYLDEIVALYKNGTGTAKIVNHLKFNHRVTISKSALDRFITANDIKRST